MSTGTWTSSRGAGGVGGFLMSSSAMCFASRISDVEASHLERVLVDELAPGLHFVAHQHAEDLVGGHRVLDAHAQQAAALGVHRRLPELIGVHLAEALVALDGEALLGAREELLQRGLDGFE